ncbi:hypothetical protein KC315_g4527 [Hortaea werneckii]|nr:hypothetical protein KC315_g4527 [Hortaea werneckii]
MNLTWAHNTKSKVVNPGGCGILPYPHATGFKIPLLAHVNNYLRDMSFKDFHRINAFRYEIRGKDSKALSDAMMLHVELYRLPAPFDDKNSTPHGQEGTDGAISVPSLYIRNVHVHLPVRLRIGRRRAILFDTTKATSELERCVMKHPQVWRPRLKGHQLLHDLCEIILCTYSHRQAIGQTGWDARVLVADLFLTERTRTDVDWTRPLSLTPGLGDDRTPRCVDRSLTCDSRWLAAKLERWDGDTADPSLPQLELVVANGTAVSLYVSVLTGRTPSSANMAYLYNAYRLADFRIDEPAENVIMNAIVDLCSKPGSMAGIDVDYVLEYMPDSLLRKSCVDFCINRGKKREPPEHLFETLLEKVPLCLFATLRSFSTRSRLCPASSDARIIHWASFA